MRKITGLLCAAAMSAAIVAAGLSPAVAQTPSAGTTAAPSASVLAAPAAPPPVPPTAKAKATPTPTPTPKATVPATTKAPPSSAPAAPSTAKATPKATVPATTKAPPPSAPAAPSAVPSTAKASPTTPPTAGPAAPPRPEARALAAAAPGPAAPGAKDPFVSKVLALTNEYRARNGAGPLVLNTSIGAGSQQWAVTLNGRINNNTLDMAKAHRTDAGASILPAGHDMYSEIIGINGTAQQVVDWWMGSPAHRAALLDKRATDIGLGYVTTTKAGWGGMTVAVGNLAGYPASRKKQPQPAPTPVFQSGDIAAVDSAGNLYAYPSAKGGDLWKRTFISPGWAGVQQMTVTDYNNDGLQDLVTVWADGRLTASYGLANGTLKAAQRIGSGWGPYEVVITKWKSGSTYPSIVAKSRTTGQLFLYPNLNGSTFGARQQIGTGWGPLTIIGADFDGDRNQDLLARNAAGQLLLYRGNGSGTFVNETRRVVGTGWSSMSHISGSANHVGPGSYGVLARTVGGDLLYYPILGNRWGTKLQLGKGGWSALKLGS